MPLRRRPAAHCESDLPAFEIAIERSHPGSVMTGCNKVNGDYAGGNAPLINDVLKGTRGHRGLVMPDWGATPDREFALCRRCTPVSVEHRLSVLTRRPHPGLPPARGQLRQERHVIRSCL